MYLDMYIPPPKFNIGPEQWWFNSSMLCFTFETCLEQQSTNLNHQSLSNSLTQNNSNVYITTSLKLRLQNGLSWILLLICKLIPKCILQLIHSPLKTHEILDNINFRHIIFICLAMSDLLSTGPDHFWVIGILWIWWVSGGFARRKPVRSRGPITPLLGVA